MKHSLSSDDSGPELAAAAWPNKRRRSLSQSKLAAAARPAKRCRSHSESKPALQPFPLTRDALSTLQISPFEGAAFVNRWASSCTYGKDVDPNHPRLLAQTLRRAKARSRTPSPVKKPPHCATPEYRNGTMKLAGGFCGA